MIPVGCPPNFNFLQLRWKVVCFRALRTPGSSLRDVLRGHRLGMDCHLADGSVVVIINGLPTSSCCSLSDTSFPLHIIRQKRLEMRHFSINHLRLVILVERFFLSTCYLVLFLGVMNISHWSICHLWSAEAKPEGSRKPTWALRKPRRNDEQSQ